MNIADSCFQNFFDNSEILLDKIKHFFRRKAIIIQNKRIKTVCVDELLVQAGFNFVTKGLNHMSNPLEPSLKMVHYNIVTL